MSGHWMLIITAAALLIGAVIGYVKGFLKIAVTLAVVVLAMVIVSFLRPVVTTFLVEQTNLYDHTRTVIAEAVEKRIDQAAGSRPTEEESLEGVTIPETWKKAILKDYSPEAMCKAKVTTFAEFVGHELAYKIISALSFVLTCLILVIGFHLILAATDVISKIPVLHGVNKTFGALFGLITATLLLWLFHTVVSSSAAVGAGWAEPLIGEIADSKILTFFYDGGLLEKLGEIFLG